MRKLDKLGFAELSSPRIIYHFLIEFLELAVSCLGLGEGGCLLAEIAMVRLRR